MPTTSSGTIQAMFSESTTRICVGIGNSLPISANMFSNTGTTKVSIAIIPMSWRMSTTTGYVIADLMVWRS